MSCNQLLHGLCPIYAQPLPGLFDKLPVPTLVLKPREENRGRTDFSRIATGKPGRPTLVQ